MTRFIILNLKIEMTNFIIIIIKSYVSTSSNLIERKKKEEYKIK